MKATYEGICEKLGFDPLGDPHNLKLVDFFENDNYANEYDVLNEDEFALLHEIGVALQNIRKAVGFY